MALVRLLTSLDGRISRVQYWAGLMVLSVVGLVLKFAAEALHVPHQALVMCVTIYPMLVLMMKRGQDRDHSVPFNLAVILALVAPIIVDELSALSANSIESALEIELAKYLAFVAITLEPHAILGTAIAILSVLTLFVVYVPLIDFGLLKGTDGPNQYGPDPLALAKAKRASLTGAAEDRIPAA